ncbi:MAG: hypothetical protein ABR529_02820 [Actinomycetota bacterium]
MRSNVDLPPPRTAAAAGGDRGWAELARGLARGFARRLHEQLARAGIEDRSLPERSRVTVLVRRAVLEEARFVLAVVSYQGRAAVSAPRAEIGPSRWVPAIRAAAALAVVLIAFLLLSSPWGPRHDLSCPGRDDSYVRAIRGGCLQVHVGAIAALGAEGRLPR